MNKEQKQIIILSVLLFAIVGTLLYFNYDKLLPKPKGAQLPAVASQRIRVTSEESKSLFDRDEYKALKEFGSVPVRPIDLGNKSPFNITRLIIE